MKTTKRTIKDNAAWLAEVQARGATLREFRRDKGREWETIARVDGKKIGAYSVYAFHPECNAGWVRL